MRYRNRTRLLAFFIVCVIVMSLLPAVSAAQPKLVALTFDDGPGPYTERLLNGLEERGVHATFFCLGNRAELYPDLIKRMMRDGHQVANHSYSHPNLNELTTEKAVQEIETTDQILNRILGGSESHYLRPPYGNIKKEVLAQMKAPVFIWSVDTIDWQLLNTTKVKDRLLEQTFDGSVVLMHDIHYTTVDAVLAALDTLADRGYEFVTLKELYRRRGSAAYAGGVYYDCRANGTDYGFAQQPVLDVVGAGETIEVTLSSPDGAPIYYTLDGSDITFTSNYYTGTFSASLPCTIRAVSAWDLNGDRSKEVVQEYTLPPASKPQIRTENGTLILEPAAAGETIYVMTDGAVEGAPWNQTSVERGSWFSCYSDGEGLAASTVTTLLYTDKGNLASDLDPEQWFYEAMDHCISKGYIKGSGNWTYQPQTNMTRAMLAELLYRYDGERPVAEPHGFVDVPENAYYNDALSWAVSREILNGVGNGIYAPDKLVTRQELAKVLYCYLRLQDQEASQQFLDGNAISQWAHAAVQSVSAAGLMNGSGGSFRPKDPVTRAEIATLLMRMDEMR